MTDAADTAEFDPDRLSFIRTLNIVRRQVTNHGRSKIEIGLSRVRSGMDAI